MPQKFMRKHCRDFFQSGQTMNTYEFYEIHPDLINTEDEIVLGIDEAGRGPVLGPMVYSCCFTKYADHERIREHGCVDSKALKDEDRRRILKKIEASTDQKVENFKQSQEEDGTENQTAEKADSTPNPGKSTLNLGYITQVLTSTFLSVNQLAPIKYNLNDISHDFATWLIRKALELNINVKHVFVDTVGPPEKYQQKLERRFPNIQFCVAKKADDIYACVSAASIVAKVCRDMLVENWEHLETGIPCNSDFGKMAGNEVKEEVGQKSKNKTKKEKEVKFPSGYPADSATIQWLEQRNIFDPIFGFPQFIRFDWSTAANRIEKNAVKIDFYDDDEVNKKKQAKQASKAFKRNNSGEVKYEPEVKRSAWFRNHNLKRVQETEELFSL